MVLKNVVLQEKVADIKSSIINYVNIFVATQKVVGNMDRQNVLQQLPIVRLQMFNVLFFLCFVRAMGEVK